MGRKISAKVLEVLQVEGGDLSMRILLPSGSHHHLKGKVGCRGLAECPVGQGRSGPWLQQPAAWCSHLWVCASIEKAATLKGQLLHSELQVHNYVF